MLKKMIALAAVCAAALFAADEAPAKKQVKFGFPAGGWHSTKAEILKFIEEKVEPFKDTAINYEATKGFFLALAEVNDTNAATYPEIKAIMDKYLKEGDNFFATRTAAQICFCKITDVKTAYLALQGRDPFNYSINFYLNKIRSDACGFTADQIYDKCMECLEKEGNVSAAINQLVRAIPNVTKKEADVLADLKKLNRKFSPYLLDDKKKDAYEPIVAKIRTMIATY